MNSPSDDLGQTITDFGETAAAHATHAERQLELAEGAFRLGQWGTAAGHVHVALKEVRQSLTWIQRINRACYKKAA